MFNENGSPLDEYDATAEADLKRSERFIAQMEERLVRTILRSQNISQLVRLILDHSEERTGRREINLYWFNECFSFPINLVYANLRINSLFDMMNVNKFLKHPLYKNYKDVLHSTDTDKSIGIIHSGGELIMHNHQPLLMVEPGFGCMVICVPSKDDPEKPVTLVMEPFSSLLRRLQWSY